MSTASDPGAWVEKARQEGRSARRLPIEPPELEDAAYHVHQAVEKAAKAVLVAAGVRYPRGKGTGHDLDVLAGLNPGSNPLQRRARSLANLTPWATPFRYPADDPFTAEPPPSREGVERRLAEAEAFVEVVAAQIASTRTGA